MFDDDVSTPDAGSLPENTQVAQVMCLGVHYFNGKSSQYQTFDQFEQQIGFGLWYDY